MRLPATIFASLLVLTMAAPAFAGDEAPPKPADQVIKLSPVALPIVVEGRVVNYIFVTVQVDLSPSADVIGLRDKEPDFRDALVRDAHRTPFVLATDYNRLDDARMKAALYRDVVAMIGQQSVRGIEVVSEAPQHNLRPPRTAPATSR